jgi:hypothetical protein
MSSYSQLVLRNAGYIDAPTQERIRNARLLIAGCGIGSGLAICATRLGFERFLLVDGDTVDAHNLNRQFFDFADVGKPKVQALREHILRINPQADVQVLQANLDDSNTDAAVSRADIVFDTVDFLDLGAILRLHGSARQQRKPVFTALSVGFGALVWYFPAESPVGLTDLLAADLGAGSGGGAVPDGKTYAEVFASFVQRIAPVLDTDVVEQIARVLSLLKEGKPCPAPQVAVGSFAVAAMATAMIQDMLAGRDVPAAPSFVVHSFRRHLSQVVDVSQAS